MKKRNLFLSIVGGIVVLDQITKVYIENSFDLFQKIEVIENIFSITHVRNKGAAFGLLSSFDSSFVPVFFILASFTAMGVILYLYKNLPEKRYIPQIALSLIFAGALGNLIDRLRIGEVIDFLDFHWYQYHWPSFNIADSSITVGVIIFILNLLFSEKRKSFLES